jgi:hypothetical protein
VTFKFCLVKWSHEKEANYTTNITEEILVMLNELVLVLQQELYVLICIKDETYQDRVKYHQSILYLTAIQLQIKQL